MKQPALAADSIRDCAQQFGCPDLLSEASYKNVMGMGAGLVVYVLRMYLLSTPSRSISITKLDQLLRDQQQAIDALMEGKP